jgi:hypothetical protein
MSFNLVSLFTFALISELVVVAALALLLRSTQRAIELTEVHEQRSETLGRQAPD